MKYMRITAGYSWTDHKTNRDCKGIKYNSSFVQNAGLQINWIRHENRMPGNSLRRVIKNYTPKGRRNQGKTTEDTSGCVRPELVKKWAISIIAT
jgi:hypothetical protein